MKKNQESLTEFGVISRFFSNIDGAKIDGPETDGSELDRSEIFSQKKINPSTVRLGVGDDCALLSLPAGHLLALSIDTQVAGRHFPEDAAPYDIARRAMAAAVSDLAAMGATPLAFTLALALPEINIEWLEGFSKGLRQAAEQYRMPLIGGDTTKGPLTITIQVHGSVPLAGGLQRSNAKAGDSVFVTGSLGDAAAALAMLQQQLTVDPLDSEQQAFLHQRFYAPQARVALGEKLLAVANAAIDISDGLLADLGHICAASGLAATLHLDKLPLSPVLQAVATREQAVRYALAGGDDYELCFTAAPEQRATLAQYAQLCKVPITEVGQLVAGAGIICIDEQGNQQIFEESGYQHF